MAPDIKSDLLNPLPHTDQVHCLLRHSVTSPLATCWLWPTCPPWVSEPDKKPGKDAGPWNLLATSTGALGPADLGMA